MAPPPSRSTSRPPSGSRRFDALAGALRIAVLSATDAGAVDYANPAARELFWQEEIELFGDGWLAPIQPDDRSAVDAAVTSLRREGDVAEVEFGVDVGGHLRWVRGQLSATDQEQGAAGGQGAAGIGWIGLFEDITAARAATDDLAFRADHDALTGLPTRTLLHDRIDQAVARAARTLQPIAVLFVDLDRFKPVNDRYGHTAGDLVLREIAARLRREVRAADTVARLGGDEFVLVTEDIDRDVAGRVAQRLRAAVEVPVEIGPDLRCELSASVGVAWGVPGAATAADLIRRADLAMYEAKHTASGVTFAPDSESAGIGVAVEDARS